MVEIFLKSPNVPLDWMPNQKEIQFLNGLYLVSKSIINVRASLSGTLAIHKMGLKILLQGIVYFFGT